MIEYNDEAISKLTDMDTDELQEVIDRMKATFFRIRKLQLLHRRQ